MIVKPKTKPARDNKTLSIVFISSPKVSQATPRPYRLTGKEMLLRLLIQVSFAYTLPRVLFRYKRRTIAFYRSINCSVKTIVFIGIGFAFALCVGCWIIVFAIFTVHLLLHHNLLQRPFCKYHTYNTLSKTRI